MDAYMKWDESRGVKLRERRVSQQVTKMDFCKIFKISLEELELYELGRKKPSEEIILFTSGYLNINGKVLR